VEADQVAQSGEAPCHDECDAGIVSTWAALELRRAYGGHARPAV